MANEIQVTGSLQYTNSAQSIAAKLIAISGALFTITGKLYSEGMQTVPTTAGGTAIPLAGITGTLGWAIFKNNDPTNYLELMTAVSGTKFAKIAPGEIALFRFSSNITAPAAIANTASVSMEYLILEQ